MKRIGRLAFLVLLLSMLAPPAIAADEAGSGLGFYQLVANAPAIGIGPLYTDVAVTVPQTVATLSTGGVGTGFSAIGWPGPIVGNAGTTALVLAPQLPPEASLLNDPVRAESHSGGDQNQAVNTSVPGTTMASSALPDKVNATSMMGSTVLPIGDVAGMRGAATVSLAGPTGALSVARSAVNDVSLAGGIISIGSVVSTATASSNGVTATASGSTVVSGLTIAGVPVSVDSKGIHVKDTAIPVGITTAALNSAVKQLGLTVLMSQPILVVSRGNARYDSAALAIVFTKGAATYTVSLGRASVGIEAAALPAEGGLVSTPTAAANPTVGAPSVTGPAPTFSPPLFPGSISPVNQPQLAGPGTITTTRRGLGLASYALSQGLPAGLLTVGLLGVVFLTGLLRRLPDRVLNLPDLGCDERHLR